MSTSRDIKLPQLGEGADSGTVVKILVAEGDTVAKDDPLIELENEKAVAPIPAPRGGRISEIVVSEGQEVSVGDVLVRIREEETGGSDEDRKAENGNGEKDEKEKEKDDERGDGKDRRREREEQDSEREEPQGEAESSDKRGEVAASPTVRRIARQLDLDLRRVRGTGRGGRIALDDLRSHIRNLERAAAGGKEGKEEGPASGEKVDFEKWGEIERRPLSSMRKTISRRLADSWRRIPHVTQFEDADITDLLTLNKRHADRYEEHGARLTLTGFLIVVVAKALKEFPELNASLDEARNELVLKQYVHIGTAVATEDGLLVPVLRDADTKSLIEIARELEELAEKARERKTTSEEMQGASFTISNQGGIGGGHFTPIINPPEAAILGVGRGRPVAALRGGARTAGQTMLPLCLSYDHRIIDGARAARFVTALRKGLEEFPETEVELDDEND